MGKILYFDICAFVILLILFFSMFFRKMTKGRPNLAFIAVLLAVLLAGIFDFWSESYGIWLPIRQSDTWFRYMLYYGYFYFRNLQAPIYIMYICAVTGSLYVIRKNKRYMLAVWAPFLIDVIALISNLFHHQIFYISEELIYTRGPLMWILYACSTVYMIGGVAYLLSCRKILPAYKIAALISLFALNLFAILIQMFWPAYLIEIFATTVSILIVTITVQRPEEMIDTVIGVQNSNAYTLDTKKAYYAEKPLRIIFVKLTNHKALLSLLGYENFNGLLKAVAAEMAAIDQEERAKADLYCLGNGLFSLMLEEEKEEKVQPMVRRLEHFFQKSMRYCQLDLRFQVCICVVRCPEEIESYQALLEFGTSFHKMLQTGNGTLYTGDLADQEQFHMKAELNSIINRALAQRRFEMYYQPIYCVKTKSFASAEALIRLKDEKYGFVSPALFIPVAEKSGAILQIGNFVLEDVCRFISESDFARLGLKYIEINLSVNQCMQENMAEEILGCLKKYQVPTEKVNLEITETAADFGQDIMMANLKKLSSEKITFSLDDYGTGYSNIRRVASLPIDIVKLDKSFVDEMNKPQMWTVLKNTICMLKEMDKEILVEGVEDENAAQKFVELGCDYIQGFYFSKPLPEKEFVAFLQAQ